MRPVGSQADELLAACKQLNRASMYNTCTMGYIKSGLLVQKLKPARSGLNHHGHQLAVLVKQYNEDLKRVFGQLLLHNQHLNIEVSVHVGLSYVKKAAQGSTGASSERVV